MEIEHVSPFKGDIVRKRTNIEYSKYFRNSVILFPQEIEPFPVVHFDSSIQKESPLFRPRPRKTSIQSIIIHSDTNITPKIVLS